MKKLMLFAAVAVFGLSNLNAQTEKGKWVFGSDAGISFASSTAKPEVDGTTFDVKSTTSKFEVNPNVGYFIIENLAIGLDLSFTSSKDKIDDGFENYEETTNAIGILPNATYFFKKENLAPYIGAGIGFLSISGGDEDFDKSSGLALSGTAGLAYFLNTYVSFNFGVNYVYSKQTNKEFNELKIKSNTIGIAVGFAVYL